MPFHRVYELPRPRGPRRDAEARRAFRHLPHASARCRHVLLGLPENELRANSVAAAVERGVGVFGIKVFGNAFLLRTFSAGDCLRYSLSLPITATPLGACTLGQIEDDVRIAQTFPTRLLQKRRARCWRAPQSGKLDTIRGTRARVLEDALRFAHDKTTAPRRSAASGDGCQSRGRQGGPVEYHHDRQSLPQPVLGRAER